MKADYRWCPICKCKQPHLHGGEFVTCCSCHYTRSRYDVWVEAGVMLATAVVLAFCAWMLYLATGGW